MSLHTKEGSHIWGPLQDTFLKADFWGQRASTHFKALVVLWANCFPESLCFAWVGQNTLSDCTSFWTIVLAFLLLWQGRWCALAISFSFFFSFIFISWRLITSQHCSGFCHTLTWISHRVTCIPHLKNWCFWTVVLETNLESPLDSKEIKSVDPKGNQP